MALDEGLKPRLEGWWRRSVWEESGGPALRRLLRVQLRAWDTALRAFERDLLDMRAHALTFRTLLSLVPLLAVAFSLFGAFGGLAAGQRALHALMLENLAPGAAASAAGHIDRFVSRVSAGAIGGVGVVALFLTVVSLLTYIERSFNALWNVERVRPFFSRFVTYWAMVTVGPVLLALSLSLTSAAQSHALVAGLDALAPGSVGLLSAFVPWVISCAALTLLYQIVPNTHVNWRAALGGGLAAGTLWELGKLGFTWASTRLFRYGAVYGSLGALPVFLLWLQVGWVIVLLGCKVAYGLQNARALREERTQLEVSGLGREFLGLRCMLEVARAFLKGEPPPSAETLAAGTMSALGAEQEVLNRLTGAGLLYAVPRAQDGAGEEGFVPARDPSLITLREVAQVFRRTGASLEELDTGAAASAFARRILQESEEAAAAITGLSLAEAVRQSASSDEAASREG